MLNADKFRQEAHRLVDWMADYLRDIEQYPVKSRLAPGDIKALLPLLPPNEGEDFAQIFQDFETHILPGITHWQHPGFMGYFPANSSFPSVLAEMLTATLGAQCMIWETSPAAAELEERMMDWLKVMQGLPSEWAGVIQDTASTATLCALLTAREKISNYQINQKGLSQDRFRVYASEQTHSSIEKAVRIAGLGSDNLVKIPTDAHFAMIPEALEAALMTDKDAGWAPLCVVATLGTTSSTAIDPLPAIGQICAAFQVFLHVDAAYAGTAALLPEKRAEILAGIELADTYLFNPHKWMFTNFDCTAYFVKDPQALRRTFEILPEYLKTDRDREVNNYRDWGIPLGRRFRALKLWFVIRDFGMEGLQARLRQHLALAQDFAEKLRAHPDFEILAPVNLNLVCFCWRPRASSLCQEAHNDINRQLLAALNASGQVYLTHTVLRGQYTLRAVFGNTYVSEKHVEMLWALLLAKIQALAPLATEASPSA
ncbi:MAG: aspartate aminotransferase family protein [Microscillaceae bacterium]